IQLVDRETKKLSEPQTIPPYFSSCRHATRDDVERIYEVTDTSATLGTITGVEPFHVQLDMKKLVEKPFAIFGRTGTGKSILNKLVCAGILSKDVGSVLIFDMHSEYGVFSATPRDDLARSQAAHRPARPSAVPETDEGRQRRIRPHPRGDPRGAERRPRLRRLWDGPDGIPVRREHPLAALV